MSDLKYSWATWRIEIAKGAFIEVHVKGCSSDSQAAEPLDAVRAARILNDLARTLDRVRERWKNID